MSFRVESAKTIDAFYLKSHKLIADKLFSQVIDESNFMDVARELGMFVNYTDLSDLRVNLRKDRINGQFYPARGKIDLEQQNNKTDAEFPQGHAAWTMVSYFHDMVNTGKSDSSLKDLFALSKKEMMEDAPELIENHIFSNNDGRATGIGFDGMQFLFPSTSINSPGGIDKSVSSNSYWKHKILPMSGKSFSVHGINYFRDMINQCDAHGNGGIKLIVTTSEISQAMQSLGMANMRQTLGNKELNISPSVRLMFDNAIVTWSKKVPEGVAYFLNPKYTKIMMNSNNDMFMHPGVQSKDGPGDMSWAITKTMGLMVYNFRAQGMAHSIKVEQTSVVE